MPRSKLYGEGAKQAQPPLADGMLADPDAPPAPNANNYVRPGGQNVGNFLTERSSSRVLAVPGGTSQIVFGDNPPPPAVKARSRPPPLLRMRCGCAASRALCMLASVTLPASLKAYLFVGGSS